MNPIRLLQKSDYIDYLNLLQGWKETNFSKTDFEFFVSQLNKNHLIFVYIVDEKIVASVTILFEKKLIRNCASAAHVEDLVVKAEFQRKKIGKQLIQHAIQIAKDNKCYKIILNCDSDLQEFYKKYGFVSKNVEMSIYF